MSVRPDVPAPLRVLRVIARLNVGGAARHVLLLDRGLRSRGHHTLLVHGSVDEGEASIEHLASSYGVPAVKLSGLGRRISPLGDMVALWRLIRLTFAEAPDVVHTHTAKAGTLGRLAALVFNATRSRRRRCVVVHTFHGHVLHGYFHPLIDRLVRAAERLLGFVTTCIVTISPSQRHEIVNRFRIAAASKTVVVPLGLELDDLLPLAAGAPSYRPDLALGPEDVVVGYVGRLVPIKNPALLVRAFAGALQQVPTLCLLIAGDGPLRAALEELARELGVGRRIAMLGWVGDLARLYATIDICALSSINEGTPVALIEAMAAGRAVVATEVGGVADVVDHGISGLLVPPGDEPALTAAIVRLAGSAAMRAEMGIAGRRRVEERYSHQRLADDMERLYESLFAERRARRRGTRRAEGWHRR